MKMNFAAAMGSNLRMDEVADHARVAEETGYSHIAYVDQPYINPDVFVMMTVAAQSTHRIHIGQAVTDPYTYRPWVIANSTASVNELSGGRAFVGIGAGGPWGKMMNPIPQREFREAVVFIKKYLAGEEAECQGVKMRSTWIPRPLPVYVAASGPRACQLAGELGDGVLLSIGVNPTILKWRMEYVEKGALKAGRDLSKLDIWIQTMIYVADSKEAARREVVGYVATQANAAYWLLKQNHKPEIQDLGERLEREHPGIINEFKAVYEGYDYYKHERTDSPQGKLVTQRLIDFFHLTGTPEDICEGIDKVAQTGVKTICAALYTIVDKKDMMREIGNRIMPHFRN